MSTLPPRRILSIWLAQLAMDRWEMLHESKPHHPLVLIADSAHGPRVTAASRAGYEAGAQAGMMLADLRALCPQIATAPADPAGDLALLEALALWAQRWGPWSALDPPDGLVVDVTGVAHLYGGEDALLADAARHLRARGLTARLAIAPTTGAAWALAHYGPERAILSQSSPLGGGGSHAVADGGGLRAASSPLRPACGGPPPPEGEDLGGAS